MKKLLFIMGFCCAMNMANAQGQAIPKNNHSLQDSHHADLGYIGLYARVYDNNNKLIAQFKNDGTIVDGNSQVIGYMKAGYEYQDKDHKTLGYLKNARNADGVVEDSNHKTLGYMKYDGSGVVEDNNHSLIGYEHTEAMWAAPYFFFYHQFN